MKEQMGVRFLGISHVRDTKAISLKTAIESMLMKNGLSISRVRGQGYDGASNMKGEINGLKTLILEESPSAYYIHCFAHRLQLTLVAVAQNHDDVNVFFFIVGTVTNLVGASCKRQDIIRQTQANKIEEAIALGELETGRGLNQEIGMKRPSDTHLEGDRKATAQASVVLIHLEDFEFAFMMKLMIEVLSITNELSIALQNKDQDIVNAIHLVNVSKRRETIRFCIEESIEVPNSSDIYVRRGKSKRIRERVTCLHHFQVEVFYTVIDMQLQEINNSFDEVNCQLLLSMACLHPHNSFAAFNKEKLMHLATFYPIATASVERAFSSMKYVKNDLRNRMNDEWLSDALVTYIEQDLCASLDKECVLQCFQNMKSRRGSL
ncbi:Zinc finger MYM-type protein 1 [Linum perenne]